MRRRTWSTLGTGAFATLAATALVTGLAGSSGPGGGSGPFAPPAADAALPAFTDCAQLQRWYVDAALPHVTAWGLDGGNGPIPIDALATPDRAVAGSPDIATGPEAATGPGAAVDNGPTGTNVQEAGVDEPDLAKTDGRLVVHVDGRRVVLTDVRGSGPRRLSTLPLPRDLTAAELLLDGDRLVVIGTGGMVWPADTPEPAGPPPPWPEPPGPEPGRPLPPGPAPEPTARVLVVDVADRLDPRVVHDASLSGSVVSARQHDDVVRLVLTTTTPALDFVEPRRGRTPQQARFENERLVRESPVEAWLPTVEVDGVSSPLVECDDVRHPGVASGYGTVTVVALDPDEPADRRATAVTTGGDLVYSSAERLYLATGSRRDTGVHAFELDGLATTYVASGRLPGTVRDRWSMSEHDGHLRVATALGPDPWEPDQNAVVVLEQRGADLTEVGRVDSLGIREQIRSVRWFGDVGVVVTFRQVDPLYTLDLSDPTAPALLGELKIPGFSSYLHPLGEDLLLGVGQHADRRGVVGGAQASVFDLGDLAVPRRLSVERFGPGTAFTAATDPRGLTYLPDQDTVLAVLEDWTHGARLVALHVEDDGSLTSRASVPLAGPGGYGTRTLPLPQGRIALVTGGVVSLLDLPRPTG